MEKKTAELTTVRCAIEANISAICPSALSNKIAWQHVQDANLSRLLEIERRLVEQQSSRNNVRRIHGR